MRSFVRSGNSIRSSIGSALTTVNLCMNKDSYLIYLSRRITSLIKRIKQHLTTEFKVILPSEQSVALQSSSSSNDSSIANIVYKHSLVSHSLMHTAHEDVISPELLRGVERFWFSDGEDAKEAFSGAEVVVADGGVVLLPRRVQNINLYLFAVQYHLQPHQNYIYTTSL